MLQHSRPRTTAAQSVLWLSADRPTAVAYITHLKTACRIAAAHFLSSLVLSLSMSRSVLLLLAVLAILVCQASGEAVAASACLEYDFTSVGSTVGFNYPGFDLYHVATANVSDCSLACCAADSCQAFTFLTSPNSTTNCTTGSGCCYLKYQRQDPVASTVDGIVSGVVLGYGAEQPWYGTDYMLSFLVTGNVSNLASFTAALQLDVSLNLARLLNVSAAFVGQYVRVVAPNTYIVEGDTLQASFVIMSLITGPDAASFPNYEYAYQLQAQIAPPSGKAGYFYAPNSAAMLTASPDCQVITVGQLFPSPAVLGAAVYDARINMHFTLSAHPTNNSMSQWLGAIKTDIAVNIAFLAGVNDTSSLLPFISIQSPAIGTNPASLLVGQGSYTLTFTLSAYITTVTGPWWTPDVIEQGMIYLSSQDTYGVDLFQPFSSGIVVQPNSYNSITDLPPAGSTASSTGESNVACQSGTDVTITFQARFTNSTVGTANSALFIQLIQADVAFILSIDAGSSELLAYVDDGYGMLEASAFMPYVQVVWPFLTTAGSPVIESYSPFSGNSTVQPFANQTGYFYIKVNVLSSLSCLLDGASAFEFLEDGLMNSEDFGGLSVNTPNAKLLFNMDEAHQPHYQFESLSGLPLCPSTATAPSCSYMAPVDYTAGGFVVTFSLSLTYPIVDSIQFNTKLQSDIAFNMLNLGTYNASQLIPYILIVDVSSSLYTNSLVQFELLGGLTVGLHMEPAYLANHFVALALAGNVSLPALSYYYGAVAPAQKATFVTVDRGVNAPGSDGSSSEPMMT